MERITNLSQIKVPDFTQLHWIEDTELGFVKSFPQIIRPQRALSKNDEEFEFQLNPMLGSDMLPKRSMIVVKYTISDMNGQKIAPEYQVSSINFPGIQSFAKSTLHINGDLFGEGSNLDPHLTNIDLMTQITEKQRKSLFELSGYRRNAPGEMQLTDPSVNPFKPHCACLSCPCVLKVSAFIDILIYIFLRFQLV